MEMYIKRDTLNLIRHLISIFDMSTERKQDPNSTLWDPDNTTFPLRSELPALAGAPKDAAWVWGPNDNLGRLNLVTPSRIVSAATEIKSGESCRVDLPLSIPVKPSFGRETFKHDIKVIEGGVGHDDLYTLNTQSGTQWDGFRHISHAPSKLFYNNTRASDITGSDANDKCGIHHWAQRGIAGRGVLLDFVSYAEKHDIKYDSASSYAISFEDLVSCGQFQGLDIRPAAQGGDIQVGDILFIRSGFVRDYFSRTEEENIQIGSRQDHIWAGVKQEQEMIDWLHNCYFAAVAGDAPAFERWPSPESYKLHEYLLALWGVPIGEMLALEGVSVLAKKHQRWTFFFTTAPANCPGGVGSHVNGTAIF
ncbi:conserved hypothetical protein [Talaromyces stipitatus ATCC 10500]|uniref:Cyclase n=1 Tax=Talaromyces stipitatus (strain ATCC 10500 / CBS 375.48 / QM 6759 / NRRL 1006) TaxID=441959 RepID=B8MAL5_TALSN|nr:uncharacterized protein TSTA_112710 [Talaromyces stipitatus ATCC 10500]EED17439.1 conserved hypothetical protein [Talaromyces stipitatus ATCC 10500]